MKFISTILPIGLICIGILVIFLVGNPEAEEVTTLDSSNNFTLTWNCTFGFSGGECIVPIQNLNTSSKQDFNLSILISETNYPVEHTIISLDEWKGVDTEIPTYGMRIVNSTCYYNNETLNQTIAYNCTYNESYINGSEIKELAQWKSCIGKLFNEGNARKFNGGIMNFPKGESKRKGDDFNTTITKNGTKTFRVIFMYERVKLVNGGYGSSGRIVFINEIIGVEYE